MENSEGTETANETAETETAEATSPAYLIADLIGLLESIRDGADMPPSDLSDAAWNLGRIAALAGQALETTEDIDTLLGTNKKREADLAEAVSPDWRKAMAEIGLRTG